MKPNAMLYWKEIKSNYKFFLFLLVFQAGYIFFLLDINIFQTIIPISESTLKNTHFIQFSNLILYGSTIIFPCLFFYSWYIEEKTKTNYQLLLLPGRIHTIIKYKILAIITLGILWVLGIEVFLNFRNILYSFNLIQHGESFSAFWISSAFFSYLRFFSHLIILLGISCAVVGLLQIIKRYRFLVGTVVFLLLCYTIFIKLIPIFRSFLLNLANKNIRDFTLLYPQFSSFLLSLVLYLYPLLLGIACMYMGFSLFEKYSEV